MSVKEVVAGWTDTERAEAIRELLQFPLGGELFIAWRESTNTCPMEFCILDMEEKNILLFMRPPNDPIFANQWHVSGALMLPRDAPEDVWSRLSKTPKYGLTNVHMTTPVVIGAIDTAKGPQLEGKCPRSTERNMIHVVYFLGSHRQSTLGTWFSIDNLPRTGADMLLGHHQRYIDQILVPWLTQRRSKKTS